MSEVSLDSNYLGKLSVLLKTASFMLTEERQKVQELEKKLAELTSGNETKVATDKAVTLLKAHPAFSSMSDEQLQKVANSLGKDGVAQIVKQAQGPEPLGDPSAGPSSSAGRIPRQMVGLVEALSANR